MNSTAIAAERQLDWLLHEVLGGAAVRSRGARATFHWLAAAVALLAAGAAVGVALLRDDAGDAAPREVQQPEIPWHECHGPGALDAVPAGVTALKCFDFDDAACARLAAFPKLEHLDLSGMDVNDKGYSVSLTITDAGVRALAPLVNLRSLSLAQCHAMKGDALQVLEAMPRLESLDLTYSGVETRAVERLERLPSLRTLVLSHCMSFHGSALAAVARMPGLRRLELRACVTVSAADALHLAKLTELRWLDLRDCQGRFRGQTMQIPKGAVAGIDDVTDVVDDFGGDPAKPAAPQPEPPPQPVQDRVGITDDVVAALAALPLETLLLGGSESLTDAIAEPLAKTTSLRTLDLAELPKITAAVLAKVPARLESLAIDGNAQFGPPDLRRLPALPALRELGLGGLPRLDDATLRALLDGKQLTALRLGGEVTHGKGGPRGAGLTPDPLLTAAAFETIAAQRGLERLSLDRHHSWLDAAGLERLATLPRLREIDLTLSRVVGDAEVARLAGSRSLQSLQLTWCPRVTASALAPLGAVPLRELNLYGTKCEPATVRDLAAKHWPGCEVKLPNGVLFRAPR